MGEVIARRQFAPGYIYLDIAFLVIFAILLLWKKRYMTFLVGLFFGIVYMAVDYGIFHLLTGSRSITEGYSLFWVLLWMSMSYGFTNFTWIWLWLSKDEYLKEWTLLILFWWFSCPMLAKTFFPTDNPITIQRTTGAYHGWMALILFAGYLILFVYNMTQKEKRHRADVLWILSIGLLVQFSWECALLIGGIRSAGFETILQKLSPLVINSLLETNLGMPYMFFIYIAWSKSRREDLKKRPDPRSFTARVAEWNAIGKKGK